MAHPPVDSSKTGVVKVDGKPATEGDVVFDPSNADRPGFPRDAPIGEDGSYTTKTLAGMNTVRLKGEVAHKFQILQHENQTYDVPSGGGSHDLEFDTK